MPSYADIAVLHRAWSQKLSRSRCKTAISARYRSLAPGLVIEDIPDPAQDSDICQISQSCTETKIPRIGNMRHIFLNI